MNPSSSVPPSGTGVVSGALPGARLALALLLAINMLNYIDRYMIAGMLPRIEEDQLLSPHDNPLTKTQLGFLAPAFVVTYMIFSMVFGLLGDRMSRWLLVGIGVTLWSFASGGSGMASSFTMLLVMRCLVGIGEAAYGPTAPTLLSDLFPVAKRGIVMSWFYMAIPVGSALGFILGGFISDLEGYGWRWAFYLTVPPGILLGLLCFFMREPKIGATDGAPVARETHVPNLKDYKSLLGIRSYVFNSIAATGMCFAVGGMSYWMPFYLYERETKFVWAETTRTEAISGKHRIPVELVDQIEAALPATPVAFVNGEDYRNQLKAVIGFAAWNEHRESLLSVGKASDSPTLAKINFFFGIIVVLGGITATLSGGLLGDYLRSRYSGSYFLVSGWSAIAGLPMFVLVLFTPLPWGWLLLFLAVFGLFFNTGPSNTILANVVPPSIRSSAFALNILLIHALGDAISPWIIGMIADASSLRNGLLLVSVMIFVSGIFWILGAKHLQADTDAAPTLLDKRE